MCLVMLDECVKSAFGLGNESVCGPWTFYLMEITPSSREEETRLKESTTQNRGVIILVELAGRK